MHGVLSSVLCVVSCAGDWLAQRLNPRHDFGALDEPSWTVPRTGVWRCERGCRGVMPIIMHRGFAGHRRAGRCPHYCPYFCPRHTWARLSTLAPLFKFEVLLLRPLFFLYLDSSLDSSPWRKLSHSPRALRPSPSSLTGLSNSAGGSWTRPRMRR
ncbi:hypothetical protein VTK26DRAFT_4216 [Humicola hyalothermophila]